MGSLSRRAASYPLLKSFVIEKMTEYLIKLSLSVEHFLSRSLLRIALACSSYFVREG